MSRSRPALVGLAAAAACVAAVAGAPGTAVADTGHGTPTVHTLNTTVLAPYQLTVGPKGLIVADGGTSTVSALSRGGDLVRLARGPQPGEVAGVAVSDRGDLAYTTLNYATGATTLTIKQRDGHTRKVDLSGFEARQNPDAGVSYGIDNPTPCQEEAFAPLGGATYTGIVDSHAYSVASLGHGEWVVGDAGGNDLIKIGRTGPPKLLTVLPRQPTTITAETATSLGLPDCVVGAVYNFEPVPTDVEVAKDGKLVVSLLPGGPEDPSLGARGSVYKVSASTGRATKVAGGFLGATNVALDNSGRIFVAELFAGQVSVIERGQVQPYVSLPGALSLVWSRGTLYAGTIAPTDDEGNPTGTGSLVAIR